MRAENGRLSGKYLLDQIQASDPSGPSQTPWALSVAPNTPRNMCQPRSPPSAQQAPYIASASDGA